MLKKILLALLLIGLTVSFGCKKEEPKAAVPSVPAIQKQADTAAQKAAKDAAAAKAAAEKTAQQVKKDVNAPK